jgi:methyltransferase
MVLMVLERLVELVITRRNERWVRQQGGIEAGAGHYPWMVLLHTLFLISCPAEVWLLNRPLIPGLAVTMLILLAGSFAVRYWTISALGRRWTTRVFCLPGTPVVTSGPYRWLRHPNYSAVLVETFALPMVHTAWLTAVVFTVANCLLLRVRIRVEEQALRQHCDYDERFGLASGAPEEKR